MFYNVNRTHFLIIILRFYFFLWRRWCEEEGEEEDEEKGKGRNLNYNDYFGSIITILFCDLGT